MTQAEMLVSCYAMLYVLLYVALAATTPSGMHAM